MRVFYAHASGDDPKSVASTRTEIKEAIANKISSDVLVVPGRDDHQRNWRGDWETWQEGVVTRRNAVTSKPVYDLFVVASTTCGRSTANILGVALTMKRPVFFWDGKFSKVESIKVTDPDDWTGGFRVCREAEQVPLFDEEANDHAQ